MPATSRSAALAKTTKIPAPAAAPKARPAATKPAAKPTPKATSRKRVSAPQVLTYLKAHPQFFETYKESLLPLPVPAKGGNLLSLHAAKSKKTDQKAQALKTRYLQFIDAAKQNAATTESIHTAILGALACATPASFRKYLQNQKEGGFQHILQLDACHLATTVEPHEMAEVCPTPLTLGPLNPTLHRPLFGANTPLIKSVCLIAFSPTALLALGSTDAARFHAGQATTLATFLGQALAAHWHNLNR